MAVAGRERAATTMPGVLADGVESEPSLRDYLDVVRRRKAPVVLALVVVLGASLISSFLQKPVYAASAEILLRPKSTEFRFEADQTQRFDPQRALQTEIRILESRPIQQAVEEKLGYRALASAAAAGQTDIILVRAESSVPRRAADIANAYATAYIEFKRKQTVDEFVAAIAEVQRQIDDLQRQIDTSTEPVRGGLIQRRIALEGERDGLELDAGLRTGGAQPVSDAEVPTEPIRPKPLRTAVLASVLGLMLGVGLAFVIEFLDDTIKTKADFERATSLPVLGLIPLVPSWKSQEQTRLVSLTEPTSPVAEAYRTLRTAVQFLGMDRPVQVVQLTSPSASEGKTTTLANLAVAMARAGRRVVVVCCDLRRPRVHEFFGLSNKVGFTSVLLGEVGLSQALQRVPDVERLFVLASGPLPPNPSELLSSRRAQEVIEALRSDGNLLLLDSPPILPVTDGLVLSKQVDATLLVSIAGRTTRKDAARAVEMLRQVDAPLTGTILNGVSVEGTYGYGYGYYQSTANGNGNGNGNGSVNGKSRGKWRTKASGQTRV